MYPDGVIPAETDMGRAIKNARNQIELSRKRLESLAGLPKNTVTSIENQEKIVTILHLAKIAAALNVRSVTLVVLAISYFVLDNEEDIEDIEVFIELRIKIILHAITMLNMGRTF